MNKRTIDLFGVPKGSHVYIAGPMTILKEKCYNFEQFFYWAAILRASGYIPINPAEMDCERFFDGWTYASEKYEEVLALDFEVIKDKADAIFNLDEWHKSTGAVRENQRAVEKGIPYFNEVDFT